MFVHGVPETPAIWDPLVAELDKLGHRNIAFLSPPGFGAPLPPGFAATMDAYSEWLVGELSKFDEPVDVLGHDWGGGHVLNVAMIRPDLLRSWISDVVGAFEPDYVWHPAAQIWQTPGDGEAHIEELFSGSTADRAARMHEMGIPGAAAERVAERQGEEMGRATLALYRSAAQPVLADAGRQLPAAGQRPGLVLVATEDQAVGTDEAKRRAADRAEARVGMLDGLGHWWMLEDPARSAQVLAEFWGAVGWHQILYQSNVTDTTRAPRSPGVPEAYLEAWGASGN